MTATSSPWSREASPSVTLPPQPPSQPPSRSPRQVPARPRQARNRLWAWTSLALLLVVAVSGGVSAAITYAALHGARSSLSSTPVSTAPPNPTTTPRYSAAETAAAKDNLCHVFDVSVRGQEGQGGLRVEGKVNVPVVLRAVNSAATVQNELVPAVPADVATAARTYISTTLDATTAAMGNTPISELNRLNDVSNDATNALLDACGLPR